MEDQKPDQNEAPKDGPKHEWVYKDRLPIQGRMTEVVKLAKQAAETELAGLRRKLKKMQYGS